MGRYRLETEDIERGAQFADAVVIGSAIIQEMEAAPAGGQVQRAGRFMQGIREALDAK